MADIVDPSTRSRMMSAIRSKDTVPELIIRRGLHAKGLRYRLHAKDLPGKPDLVFPRHGAIVMVHGCFWHGHDCPYFKLPATRRHFWQDKIEGNRRRDRKAASALIHQGWRVLTVWECALRGAPRNEQDKVIDQVARWIESGDDGMDIRGAKKG